MNLMLRAGRPVVAALSLFAAAAAAMASAAAQEPRAGESAGAAGAPVTLPSDLAASDVDALLARLPDDRVRALLLAQLKAAARERDAAPGEGLVGGVDASGVKLKQTVQATVASLDTIPAAAADVYRRLTTGPGFGEGFFRLAFLVFSFAVLIAIGAAVEAWYHRRTTDIRARIAGAPPGTAGVRIGRGLLRAFLDLMALGAFALPVVIVFVVIDPPNETARMFVAAYFAAILIVRLASLVSRIVFAPAAPALRMVPARDEDARYLHRRVLQVAAVWAFGAITCELMLQHGLAIEAYRLLSAAVGLVVIVLFSSMFWHFRTPVGNLIKGPDFDHANLEANPPGLRLRAQVGDLWHVLATVYVMLAWVVQVIGAFIGNDRVVSAAIASVVLVLLLPAASYTVRRLLEMAFSGGRTAQEREESEPVYVDAIMRSVNVLLVLFTVTLLWTAWGGGDPRASAAATVGETAAAAAFDVVLILVIADMLWKITHTAIDRRLEREGIDPGAKAAATPGGDGEGGGGGSRAGTLLPLARKTVATVLAVMVVFTILSAFGVDIGPLLAGAGVAGIAIGFGAQSLVRDIASGVFFLIDDAFRVGEYIIVGEAKGTVEHISLRSVRLRHHRGPLNTVPFGEIKLIQNLSRDWVLMKLEFRVPYDTDVERVRKIIKRIGVELLEDPVLGESFLAPLKSQGVYAMEDSAMVIRVKFMARPGEQFVIRREAFRRIREAFEAEGIPFAHRIVTVRGANESDTDSKERAAAAVAAAEEKTALPLPG